MIGNRKWLGLAVLAAAVLAPPASASGGEPKEEGKSQAQPTLESIQRQLADMQRDLRALNQSRLDIEDMGRRLDDLDRRVRRLEGRLNERTSLYTSPNPDPAAGRGTLLLVNASTEEATVTINGRGYVVGPLGGTAMVRDVPAGPFTYSVSTPVHGVIQPAVNRTLNPGATFTITIYPRPAVLPL
jgi:hypothetical protein